MIAQSASVEKILEILPDTFEVTLKMPGDFSFTAGQYVTLTLPTLKNLPVKEQFRDFSIASPPEYKGYIALAMRSSASFFKKELLKGDKSPEILVEGPKGVFILPPQSTGMNICFIAGGIGVTVFLSMIRHIVVTKMPLIPTLFYYNHSRESAPYLSELEGYKGLINLIPVDGDMTSSEIENYLRSKPENNLWYLAGPRGLVKAAREILENFKVEDRFIKSEEYSGYD